MTTTNEIVQNKAKNLQQLLEVSKKQIEAALPKHLTPERLLRIALTEARLNPKLLECTQQSFLGAIVQTAQLGLEPGGFMGQSYLVPFKNKKNNTLEVQLIVGYRGMMSLAYRCADVSHIIARAVYRGDTFDYAYGLDEHLDHKPENDGSSDELTHVYAVVTLKSGGKLFDVMTKREIEDARVRSKSAESGPWVTDYEAMAKKSVVRRLFKFSPVSIEIQHAVSLDEAGDRGEQHNANVIETTGSIITEKPTATEKFKQNVAPKQEITGNQEPEPAVDSFAAFQEEVIPPPPPQERTREQAIKNLFNVADELKIDADSLARASQLFCEKEPLDLNIKEIDMLASELKGGRLQMKASKK